ncbi:MAG TPA: MBL fold metallo-hydrolase, partial [Clostridia bacterium]|nr:MBL fold metallo-hydrolase [Clostridia bacterium]
MKHRNTQVQVKEFEDLNIFQVKLPLPFRLNHVNCYLFRDKGGWILIDTGINYIEGRRAWADAMEIIGMKPEEIKAIYLTHHHPDHYGMAGYLQQLSDAPVYISEMDASGVEIFWINYKEIVPVMGDLFRENGMPSGLVQELV